MQVVDYGGRGLGREDSKEEAVRERSRRTASLNRGERRILDSTWWNEILVRAGGSSGRGRWRGRGTGSRAVGGDQRTADFMSTGTVRERLGGEGYSTARRARVWGLGVGVLQAGRSQGGYAGPTWRGGRRLRPGYSEPEHLGLLPRTVFLISTGPGQSSFVRRYAQPLSMAYLLPVLPRLLLILPCHRHPRTHGARDVAASVSGDLGALSHPPVLPSAQRSLAGIRRVAIAKAPVRQVGRAALTWLLSRERNESDDDRPDRPQPQTSCDCHAR
jgi:hypothetical protein